MPRVANHLPDLSPLLPIASPLGFLRQKMPGARRGGPKRSQCDSSAAFRGDPSALSVMQRNNEVPLPPKIVLCCRYVQAPLFSGTNHPGLSLSRYLGSARAVWVLWYFTASRLAERQHPRHSRSPDCPGLQAAFAVLPPGAASQRLAPRQNLPQKSLIFHQHQVKKKSCKAQAPRGTSCPAGVLF